SLWWAQQPGYLPANVPDVALQPMYSTWYSFHQHVSPEAIEAEAKLAKELGCAAVIVDDGWQTADNQRGYAYCGDWLPAPEKMPDMKAHVARVHALGLKYVLWYAVPFVGKESVAWESFKDKLLRYDEGLGAGVLDPRFPEVREFLIGTYERAVRQWDLDGVKLDFVDMFGRGQQPSTAGDGRDHSSVAVASDRLLSDVIDRLRRLRPNILVEFRQTYTGPLMRKYGNMFRAIDCPGDAAQNRARIVDIRLLSGDTAAHADMIMWHPSESAEQAAIHLQNALFGVPQLSVRIAELTPAQREMTAFWLQFWTAHRDAFMFGTLIAEGPHELYPVVTGTTDDKQITVVYAERPAKIEKWRDQVWIVNATANGRVLLDARNPAGSMRVEVSDCQGAVVSTRVQDIAQGVTAIDVPRSGFVHLRPLR
ncbi:MAG: alpha-galactosidase, partial [Firmicutes bacterium]|nr:alpha-galactosidase [Bacillota bacterium]